jgi:CRISPR-associated protein Csm5
MPIYRMTLTMLSPVHIGSGEEIEPIEYVVRRRGDSEPPAYSLYAIDLPRMLARFTEAQRRDFNAAADQGETLWLRKFIDRMADPAKDARWETACNPEVHDRYQDGLRSDQAQLRVNLMTRDALTGRPYIPGSSIKGALRTAWVSHRAMAYAGREDLDRLREYDFEPEVLGYRVFTDRGPRSEIRADPFRMVCLGDAPLCEKSNSVELVEIYHPGRATTQPDPSDILMFYDATFSHLDNEEITAIGRLVINEHLPRTPTRGLRRWQFPRCVAEAITAEELLTACNEFYRPRLKDEIERFPRLQESAGRLLAEAERIGKNEAILRLGRFSHVECMTVASRGGAPARRGKTRSLLNGELPMGWVKIALTR